MLSDRIAAEYTSYLECVELNLDQCSKPADVAELVYAHV
jgi:hypothetical protein